MGRQASSSSAAQPSSSLTLEWALGQLNKQLGGLETQPCRVQSSGGKLSPCKAPLPTGSSSSSQELACMTPSTSDVGTRPLADRQHSQRSPAPSLSVHWADALEQHSQACAHAPHHAHHTPDKPCLKAQPSSCFPFLEEASGYVDALLKRPCDDCSSDQLAAVKKRSRVAAFGL